jgi:hypothetical protein
MVSTFHHIVPKIRKYFISHSTLLPLMAFRMKLSPHLQDIEWALNEVLFGITLHNR